ncbi:MAG: DUF47 domain-containing protein [Candidatus Omnitrophica bacterium]|nr:DUF47 domain-containing protein [Candidatus Omnitrophota bacterium]
MFRLMPKETAYFDLFEKSAKNLIQAAQLLEETMKDYGRIQENANRLERIEHEGDQITHEIMAKMNRTFITPIDREDIHQLASALDDVLDFIEAVTERMVLYKIPRVTPQAQQIATVIRRQAEEINKVIPRLREMNHATIMEHCIEINRLENEGDRLLREAVVQLFDGGGNPLDVMKWRELYDLLETATDKCEDVAVAIEGIVLKNA